MESLAGLSPEDYRNFFEMLFLICFGLAWPATVIKSFRSRSAKNKSVAFVILALCGYLFGIAARIIGQAIDYPLVFYIINLSMVATDLCLYVRNRRLDKLASAAPLAVDE